MRTVVLEGVELEVHDAGAGEPVVLVQTGLTADELAPLAEQLVGRGAWRTIVYHRRGYAGSAHEFRAANARLQESRTARGADAALDEFLALVVGPGWRTDAERRLPGSAEQMHRDATTFFDTDMPALLSWRFAAADASKVQCPVLLVSGTHSGPWFAEVRELVRAWLPQTEDVLIAGADHALALTHTDQVAEALAEFLGRHPLHPGGG